MLWNRVYGVPKTWRNLLCRSVWDRHPGGFGSVPGNKILDGDGTAGLFVYIVPFLISTVVGSILPFADYDSGKGGAMKLLKVAG